MKLKDVRFRLRGDIEPDKRIVIVAIDSKKCRQTWKMAIRIEKL